jgi:hypothetical protein
MGEHDAYGPEERGVRGMRGLHTPQNVKREFLDWSELVADEGALLAPGGVVDRGCQSTSYAPEALQRRVSLVLVTRTQVQPVSLQTRSSPAPGAP